VNRGDVSENFGNEKLSKVKRGEAQKLRNERVFWVSTDCADEEGRRGGNIHVRKRQQIVDQSGNRSSEWDRKKEGRTYWETWEKVVCARG